MISYTDMVRNAPKPSDELMWQTVEEVNALVEELARSHPEKAKAFLMRQYALMYGNRFNEAFARQSVSDMFHTAKDGHLVSGQVIEPDRAFAALVPSGNMDLFWDAYVAANAFLHDLARTSFSESQILDAAREFWFADDDFPNGGKVLWYFLNK